MSAIVKMYIILYPHFIDCFEFKLQRSIKFTDSKFEQY